MGLYTPYSLSRRVPSATRPPLLWTGDCMRRFAIRLGIPLLAVLLAALVILQFALPPYAEHRVEQRLTEHGGNADVSLSAFPAVRLLFKSGGDLSVDATGLSVDLTPGQKDVFIQLDDFTNVDIL